MKNQPTNPTCNQAMNLVDFIKTTDTENILNYSEISFDKQNNGDDSDQYYLSIPCKSELADCFDWDKLSNIAKRLQEAFIREYFEGCPYNQVTTPRGFFLYDCYAMDQVHLSISNFGIYLTAYFQA